MERYEIKNDILEYDDATHIYYVNGVIVPSVSKIIDFVYPSTYKDIDANILQRASELGTKMHKEIEDFEKFKEVKDSVELSNYIKLKQHFKWQVLHSEIPIIIYKDCKPICAGRIDQIIKIDDKLYVNDLKRTKDVHQDRLGLQLSLYSIGYEQCYNKDVKLDGGCCTHLRKDIAEFISINIDRYNAFLKVSEYNVANEEDDDFDW